MLTKKKDHTFWTDAEIGYLVDTMDRPVIEQARHLGRSISAIKGARHRIVAGKPIGPVYRLWTEEEDALLRAAGTSRTGPDLAEELGRTPGAVERRRYDLGIRVDVNNPYRLSPFTATGRKLLAKTCTCCGLLLSAKWFQFCKQDKSWESHCRKCKGSNYSESTRRNNLKAKEAYRRRAQALTLPLAERNHQEYTEADHAVLADPTKTALAKALLLKRTYNAVHTAVSLNGYGSQKPLGDPYQERWLIDNPNDARVQEITATLKKGIADGTLPRPEYEWDW